MTLPTVVADRPITQNLYKRLCHYIPGGVNSPVRACPGFDITPLVVSKGEGAFIWDVDGNRYLDFCMSWGALPLGHAHPSVISAVSKQMEKGSSFGITTELELQMAETIASHYPSMEKMRFVSSGTEATMTAIRLARGFTGREKIIKFSGGYHGHSDALLIRAGSGASFLPEPNSAGVPLQFVESTLSASFNDLDSVQYWLEKEEVAAVIVEPVAANMGLVLPLPGFLEGLRAITKKTNTLLIFDEVVTGYRISLGGAQKKWNITPDLTCLGKIVGGGFPAAAVGGRADILDCLAPLGPVYQAGTLSGNPIAMAAGLATIAGLQEDGVYEELEQKINILLNPVEKYIHTKNFTKDSAIHLPKIASLFTPFFGIEKAHSWSDLTHLDTKKYEELFKFLLERGVYIPPSPYEVCFVSLAHRNEDLILTSEYLLEFISKSY